MRSAAHLPPYVTRLAVCLLATAVGCHRAILDGPVSTLVVRGLVHAGGAPVADAVVDVGWRPYACGALQPYGPDTTSAAGTFEIWVTEWGRFPRACVEVTAAGPDASFQDAVVHLDSVPMRPGGLDTLEVELDLQATP